MAAPETTVQAWKELHSIAKGPIILALKSLEPLIHLGLPCHDWPAGGVQECLHMEPNLETVYLRKRHGFVRLALQHGAPLVRLKRFFLTKLLLSKCARYGTCGKLEGTQTFSSMLA